jgi:hypothetical protein
VFGAPGAELLGVWVSAGLRTGLPDVEPDAEVPLGVVSALRHSGRWELLSLAGWVVVAAEGRSARRLAVLDRLVATARAGDLFVPVLSSGLDARSAAAMHAALSARHPDRVAPTWLVERLPHAGRVSPVAWRPAAERAA